MVSMSMTIPFIITLLLSPPASLVDVDSCMLLEEVGSRVTDGNLLLFIILYIKGFWAAVEPYRREVFWFVLEIVEVVVVVVVVVTTGFAFLFFGKS